MCITLQLSWHDPSLQQRLVSLELEKSIWGIETDFGLGKESEELWLHCVVGRGAHPGVHIFRWCSLLNEPQPSASAQDAETFLLDADIISQLPEHFKPLTLAYRAAATHRLVQGTTSCFLIGTEETRSAGKVCCLCSLRTWAVASLCHAATSTISRSTFVGAPYKIDRAVLAGCFLQQCQDSGAALCTPWLQSVPNLGIFQARCKNHLFRKAFGGSPVLSSQGWQLVQRNVFPGDRFAEFLLE